MYDIEVGQNAVISLTAAIIALFLLPVIFAVLWKKHCGRAVSFKFLFFGAAGFLVSARVLELGLHMICIVNDNPVSRFINGNTAAFVIYGIFAAGIFEECGRYVVLNFLVKKNKTKENAVMYGIGHSGIEVWSVSLLSLVSSLAIAVTLQTQGEDGLTALLGYPDGIPEDVSEQVIIAVTGVAGFGVSSAFMTVYERFIGMFVHIGFTVIVAYGIEKSQKKYLLAAVLSHAAMDIFAALYQRGVVGLAAMEIWATVCAVLLTVVCVKLYKKFERSGNNEKINSY